MKPFIIFISLYFVLFSCVLKSQNQEQFIPEPNINKEIHLILCTQKIIQLYGDTIWENIHNTPLKILLITDSLEFLFNHNNPSKDFELYKYDSLLKTNIYVRPRVFPPFLRATFPAVNNQDCIVAGNSSNTEKSDEDWVIMLLHEHFHLYQGENNKYKKNIKLLSKKISNGSDNWMLDYNFPYNDQSINQLIKEYITIINETYLSIGKGNYKEKINQLRTKQAELKKLLSSNDFDYYSFQIWQEGIATYTETKYLNELNQNKDFIKKTTGLDYNLKNETHLSKYQNYLLNGDLQKEKRNLFYSIGMLQGIINDIENPEWRSTYFETLIIQ